MTILGDGTDRAHAVAAELDARLAATGDVNELGPECLLVLCNCRAFPGNALGSLTEFIERGGHLVAVGGPPFEVVLCELPDGRRLTVDALLAGVPRGHALVDWACVERGDYTRGTSQDDAPLSVSPVAGGVQVDTELLRPPGWETVSFAVAPASAGHNVVRLRAAGRGIADALLVEIRERDGARWMALVPLTPEEQECGVHVDQFAFWKDNAAVGRGGPDDRPDLANVAWVQLGFASSHQPLTAGPYGFVVKDLGTGRLDESLPRPEIPKLEGLCPAYKLFEAQPTRYEGSGAARGIRFDWPERVWSPIARPMQPHPERDTTWEPLVKGFNTGGVWCATPISTTLEPVGGNVDLCGIRGGGEAASEAGTSPGTTDSRAARRLHGIRGLIAGPARTRPGAAHASRSRTADSCSTGSRGLPMASTSGRYM